MERSGRLFKLLEDQGLQVRVGYPIGPDGKPDFGTISWGGGREHKIIGIQKGPLGTETLFLDDGGIVYNPREGPRYRGMDS